MSTGAAAVGEKDEATLNSEEIKPVAIAIIELRLSEGISQSVSMKFLKFHNNLMQWYLKTFLGLAMPNQCSQTVRKQTSSWFLGDNFGPKSPNLHDPYI